MRNIGFFFLFLLVLFPEVSHDTSLAIDKKSPHSIYLFKVGIFTVSDLLILFIAALVILRFMISPIRLGIVAPLIIIFGIYYSLGIIYNLLVYYDFKSIFYDFKLGLYLFMPYLLLKSYRIEMSNVFQEKFLFYIVLAYIAGNLIDFIYVSIPGGAEPEIFSIFGRGIYPAFVSMFPLQLLIGMIFISDKYSRFYLFFGIFELLSALNRVNLGVIFWSGINILYLIFLRLKLRNFVFIFIIIILYYTLNVGTSTLLYLNPPEIVSGFKSTGWLVRQNEIFSFIENSFLNIPVIIGKGLGTTWIDFYPYTGFGAEYAGGHLTGTDRKFIWHNTLAGHFYKFGILGSLSIVFYLAYLSNKLKIIGINEKDNFSILLAFFIPAFLIININGIGVIKGLVISSIILYLAELKISSNE